MQKEKMNIWIPSRRHLWQDECSLLQELWYKALKVLVFVKKKKDLSGPNTAGIYSDIHTCNERQH